MAHWQRTIWDTAGGNDVNLPFPEPDRNCPEVGPVSIRDRNGSPLPGSPGTYPLENMCIAEEHDRECPEMMDDYYDEIRYG